MAHPSAATSARTQLREPARHAAAALPIAAWANDLPTPAGQRASRQIRRADRSRSAPCFAFPTERRCCVQPSCAETRHSFGIPCRYRAYRVATARWGGRTRRSHRNSAALTLRSSARLWSCRSPKARAGSKTRRWRAGEKHARLRRCHHTAWSRPPAQGRWGS